MKSNIKYVILDKSGPIDLSRPHVDPGSALSLDISVKTHLF